MDKQPVRLTVKYVGNTYETIASKKFADNVIENYVKIINGNQAIILVYQASNGCFTISHQVVAIYYTDDLPAEIKEGLWTNE